MPEFLITSERALPVLRKAANTLKAALVVSAAAILSRAQGDLEANAAAATGHFDDFMGQLRAIRKGMVPVALLSATRPAGAHREVDAVTLDRALAAVDQRLTDVREALLDLVGSAERDGLDIFAERVAALGRAFDDVTALVTVMDKDAVPFLFDQFFLESIHDLAQRDWSISAADET